ncbi:uncharacterized protein LOC123582287 [Leopardus geoffroyi]|uniref:uncharacterized protein LOC123582287 n=1 Tax=Leopardus geoffroyi TaxID=46844 RepID=UPI001E25E028|nr:uncharacterized protein LOC123582287 [Leopardus geoffroyi]
MSSSMPLTQPAFQGAGEAGTTLHGPGGAGPAGQIGSAAAAPTGGRGDPSSTPARGRLGPRPGLVASPADPTFTEEGASRIAAGTVTWRSRATRASRTWHDAQGRDRVTAVCAPQIHSEGLSRVYAEHRHRDWLVLSSACRSQVALTAKRRVEKVTPFWKDSVPQKDEHFESLSSSAVLQTYVDFGAHVQGCRPPSIQKEFRPTSFLGHRRRPRHSASWSSSSWRLPPRSLQARTQPEPPALVFPGHTEKATWRGTERSRREKRGQDAVTGDCDERNHLSGGKEASCLRTPGDSSLEVGGSRAAPSASDGRGRIRSAAPSSRSPKAAFRGRERFCSVTLLCPSCPPSWLEAQLPALGGFSFYAKRKMSFP